MKSMSHESVLNPLCVLAGLCALLCLGLSYGWSVFRTPFSQVYPQWTNAQLAMVFSLSMICFGIGSLICGVLSRKWRVHHLLLAGGLIILTGFGGISFLEDGDPVRSLVVLYVFYGCMGGTGIGICYNAINSSIPRFFPAHKGTISGIMMAGYGSGALILGMAAKCMIENRDIGLLRTFRILSVFIFAVLALCAFCYYCKDGDLNSSRRNDGKIKYGFSPSQVLRLRSFWILQGRNVFSYAACLIVIENATSVSSFFGISAVVGLICSVFNGLGRIMAGVICDRIGALKTLKAGSVILFCAAMVLTVSLMTGSRSLIIMAFVLVGLGYGVTPPVSVVINDDFFGERYRETNYAFFSLTLAPASIAGPMLVGILQDLSGGGLGLRFTVVLLYAAISVVLAFILQKPVREWEDGNQPDR